MDALVRANCVFPVLIETDMAREMTPEQKALLTSKILVSDESSFVTGPGYDISGGRSVYERPVQGPRCKTRGKIF